LEGKKRDVFFSRAGNGRKPIEVKTLDNPQQAIFMEPF
jgi:hypothetical protein